MAHMSDDASEPPRRRAASAESLAAREAATLVRELNARLGLWQAESVKLHAMADRLKAAGRSDPLVAEEALALLVLVGKESGRFEDRMLHHPAHIAGHGRIADTRQSLRMILDRVASALAAMGVKPGSVGHDEGRVD